MGRKIPGKKHHGVKDPAKQAAKREQLLKQKVNSAPKNIDDQEVPRKLQSIMKSKNLPKVAKKKGDKRDENLLDSSKHMGYEMRLPGMTKPLKPVPVFKQNPGEPQRQFLRRVNRTVQQFLTRKEYEDKYNVEMVNDPKSGQPQFIDREKDEIDEEMDKVKAKKLQKKGIVLKSKEEKRKERRLKEKERRLKKKRKKGCSEDFDDFTDSVGFNEIVSAPPKLPGVVNSEARRPGQSKALLLLHDQLKRPHTNTKDTKTHKPKPKKDKVSLAKQKMLTEERTSVIEQYRAIKRKQYENRS